MPKETVYTALVAYASIKDAVAASLNTRRQLTNLRSVELMLSTGIEIVAQHLNLPPPIDGKLHPAYLLVDVSANSENDLSDLALALTSNVNTRGEAVVDGTNRQSLWQWRERHTEAIATVGVARKCDVAVPPAHILDLLTQAPVVAKQTTNSATVVCFGHVGEGAIHVNILNGDDETESSIISLAASLGGSISAKHGIGRQKRRLLGLSRSSEEITLYHKLVQAINDKNTLNPHILLPR